jgi:hypothetical protein
VAERRAKLPKGYRWHNGRIQARAYDANGKQIARHFDRLHDARKWKEGIDTDRRRGELVDQRQAKTPFEKIAADYLERELSLRRRTLDKYDSSTHSPCTSVRENVHWRADTYSGAVMGDRVRARWTIRRNDPGALCAAGGGMQVGHDGIIAKSPCLNIELPHIDRVERRYLNEGQVETLAEAHPERYRTLVCTAAYLGPRWQECAGLRVTALEMRPGRLATVRSPRPLSAPTAPMPWSNSASPRQVDARSRSPSSCATCWRGISASSPTASSSSRLRRAVT